MDRPISSLSIPPSTLSALLRAGYETTRDLDASNAEKLARDLSIPLDSTQAIYTQRNTQSRGRVPLTQPASVAVAASSAARISTRCTPLDRLLDGGLPRRHVLELSGPPGTPKGGIALGLVSLFLRDNPGDEVIVVDTQNMMTPSALHKVVPEDALGRVFHYILHTLPELVVFIHTLPSILASRPKVGLLVISSIHFPFQATFSKKLTHQEKSTVLENLKKMLVTITARGVTVVLTSHLATKMLAADGSPATFDTGARAVMVPQLSPSYLPSANSFRVLICPQARDSGVFKLLTAPTKQVTVREEPYTIPKRRMIPA